MIIQKNSDAQLIIITEFLIKQFFHFTCMLGLAPPLSSSVMQSFRPSHRESKHRWPNVQEETKVFRSFLSGFLWMQEYFLYRFHVKWRSVFYIVIQGHRESIPRQTIGLELKQFRTKGTNSSVKYYTDGFVSVFIG